QAQPKDDTPLAAVRDDRQKRTLRCSALIGQIQARSRDEPLLPRRAKHRGQRAEKCRRLHEPRVYLNYRPNIGGSRRLLARLRLRRPSSTPRTPPAASSSAAYTTVRKLASSPMTASLRVDIFDSSLSSPLEMREAPPRVAPIFSLAALSSERPRCG